MEKFNHIFRIIEEKFSKPMNVQQEITEKEQSIRESRKKIRLQGSMLLFFSVY